ncbi:MAG: molybdopterin molybdenumtransferase MoeA, partial [Nitrospinae bacterium]|nr:molybdopterin molybdenumtransferase MoeA [Nitrospinota bacterium]
MSQIKVDDARKIILDKIEPQGTEKISISEALGRILAEDIVARHDNPPMDNSAMDGYALIAADIESASPENPVQLDVIEDIAAGYSSQTKIGRGQAARIMTGAPIPPGADAVIMQEDTERNGTRVLVKDKAEVWENIRDAGEDVKSGESAFTRGVD